MPETNDPIRLLETFGTGGGHPSPLTPAEVRRLGDRRRARRRGALAVATAAVVAAVVTPFALATGAGHGGHEPTPTTPSRAPAPKVLTFPGSGVEIGSPDQVGRLVGTSAEFKAFIAHEVSGAVADGTQCPGAFHGVTVQKYSTAGYAIGGVNSCGGYEALWVRHGGAWGEGQATQDAWDCDALAYLDVPSSFTGRCFDESGTFGTTGGGGPEPGMSRAEAEAVGITVRDDAAAPPCSSTEYTSPVVPGDNIRGLFSPRDGLVQVEMTSAMKTEERIGLGSARSKVLAAYPNRQASGNVWVVPRPHDTSYVIRFGPDHRVVAFGWQLNQADCAGYMR